MSGSLVYSFLTFYLVLAIIVQRNMRPLRNKQVAIGFVILLPLVVLAISINNLPAIYYVRGAFGDLSVISFALLLSTALRNIFNIKIIETRASDILYGFVLIIGLPFYITSLGVGQIDLYSFGYSQTAVPVFLLALALLSFLKKEFNLGLLLLLPVVTFEVGLLESNNTWDYLLDPFLFIYAGIRTLSYFTNSQKKAVA